MYNIYKMGGRWGSLKLCACSVLCDQSKFAFFSNFCVFRHVSERLHCKFVSDIFYFYFFGGGGGGGLFQFCCCWLVSFICYSDKTIFATGIACMLLSLWRHDSSNLVTESSWVPENDLKKKRKEKKSPIATQRRLILGLYNCCLSSSPDGDLKEKKRTAPWISSVHWCQDFTILVSFILTWKWLKKRRKE